MSGGRAPDFALAVYGGAFDPPHPGHESVIRRALLCAERVALVPSHRHAFGKRMGDFELALPLAGAAGPADRSAAGVLRTDRSRIDA